MWRKKDQLEKDLAFGSPCLWQIRFEDGVGVSHQPGKWKRPSVGPLGEGIAGGVALGGLLELKAGEEGVEEVVEEGLLLESGWLTGRGRSWEKKS